MPRMWFIAGSVLAFLGVAAGALGAHLLKPFIVPERLPVYETAVRYHLYHALALLVVGCVGHRLPPRVVLAAGWLFVAGIGLFSGSLYALSLSGLRWIGAVTPLGGLAFLVGWGLLAWAAFRGDWRSGE